MQGRRGRTASFFDFGDPFADFGSLGGFSRHGNLLSSFFGGRDPFDDPFFTRPFGGMFDSGFLGSTGSPFPGMPAAGFLEDQPPPSNKSSGPIIEELNSDDEKDEDNTKEKKENSRKHARSSTKPHVEDPDDVAEERKSKQMQCMSDFGRRSMQQRSQPQGQSFVFQSSTVSYGGANGAYYTSSASRRTGSDGITFQESKEADTATRKATHRISRGIQDKGHSVTRKLNSDGKVDTMQTLHNLNEDEIPGFEETWKGIAPTQFSGLSGRFIDHNNMGRGGNGYGGRQGWALPSTMRPENSEKMKADAGNKAGPSSSRRPGWTKGHPI